LLVTIARVELPGGGRISLSKEYRGALFKAVERVAVDLHVCCVEEGVEMPLSSLVVVTALRERADQLLHQLLALYRGQLVATALIWYCKRALHPAKSVKVYVYADRVKSERCAKRLAIQLACNIEEAIIGAHSKSKLYSNTAYVVKSGAVQRVVKIS
jgi:hypothetical protein